MATDPSIPLSVRPPQIDDPVQKILTLRGLSQQQQMQAQEMQLRDQQMKENAFKLSEQQRVAEGDAAQAKLLTANTTIDPSTGMSKTDHQKVFQGLAALGYADRADHYLATAPVNEINLNALQLSEINKSYAVAKIQGDMLGHVLDAPPEQRAAAWQTQRANLATIFKSQPQMLQGIPTDYPGDEAAQHLSELGRSHEEILANALKKAEADKDAAAAAKDTAEAGKINKEAAGTLPETPAQKSTRLLAEARQRETERHNRVTEAAAQPFGIPGGTSAGGSAAATGSAPLTGEAFLQTLPPGQASEIKAYAEGKRPFPTGMSYAKLQPLIAAVGQYDPTFDAANYNARNKARMDLTSPSGTGGKTINALNTAIQHAGKLSELIESLDNIDSDPTHVLGVQNANAIKNWWNTRSGSTKVTNFNAVAPQLAKEIERAWRGSGGSTADVKELIDSIGSNLSRQQQREALYNFVELAKGKLDATETQRDNILGPVASKDVPILFDQNKKVIDTITQRANGGSSGQSMRREVPGHPGQFAVSSDGGKTWTAE